jgi:hypothetical protein
MESITQKIKHIMSILGLLIMVSQANAQGQQKNMMDHKEKSQMEMGRMAMGENMYPQKAEDISLLGRRENTYGNVDESARENCRFK